MLAGVPMMNGAATLAGYVPNIDATMATRILGAGATIAGKAHCESFCLFGGSHTSALGPLRNPRRMGHSAGGSSSGNAALVVHRARWRWRSAATRAARSAFRRYSAASAA